MQSLLCTGYSSKASLTLSVWTFGLISDCCAESCLLSHIYTGYCFTAVCHMVCWHALQAMLAFIQKADMSLELDNAVELLALNLKAAWHCCPMSFTKRTPPHIEYQGDFVREWRLQVGERIFQQTQKIPQQNSQCHSSTIAAWSEACVYLLKRIGA